MPIGPKLLHPGDPQDPFKNGAFINIIEHGGHLLALNGSTPGFEITRDLDTIGEWKAGTDKPLRLGALNAILSGDSSSSVEPPAFAAFILMPGSGALNTGTGKRLVKRIVELPLSWALISPTDPVAVLSTLKAIKVPQPLETDTASACSRRRSRNSSSWRRWAERSSADIRLHCCRLAVNRKTPIQAISNSCPRT
jgi:hypothetical protein